MALREKQLYVKRSSLPGAGRGLFTKKLIPKGTRIVEYKGEILTWKEVEKMPDNRNGYVFYFNRNYVIDAWRHKGFAHFANDALGITRIKGFTNNSEYVTEGKRCYIKAERDIPAKSEIFVGYGAEYWQVIRYNRRLEAAKKKRAGKSRPGKALPLPRPAKRLRRHKTS
jgi:SET domain-containing protein